MLAKYDDLGNFLDLQPGVACTLGFRQIEQVIIRSSLPDSARKHREWWSNNGSQVHARSWMERGWRVVRNGVDLRGETVRYGFTG